MEALAVFGAVIISQMDWLPVRWIGCQSDGLAASQMDWL